MLSIDKREIIERYIEAYNTFDIELMLLLLHPDVKFINLSNGEVNTQTVGKSDFRSTCKTIGNFN
jgi:hypothetical protein